MWERCSVVEDASCMGLTWVQWCEPARELGARGKRQLRSRRAPQESDQSATDFVCLLGVSFERGCFPPSFFHFFWDQTSSLSDLIMGRKIVMKPRYLGSRRSKNADNLVQFQKSEGKKGKIGCPISKKTWMSDLRLDRQINWKSWYLYGRPSRDTGTLVRFEKKFVKRRKWDVRSKKTKDVRSQMKRKYRHKTKKFRCQKTSRQVLTMDWQVRWLCRCLGYASRGFVPLPVCDHSQGVYFTLDRRRSIVFRVLFQQTNKQTNKQTWKYRILTKNLN